MYTKLFNVLLTSSVWNESDSTRVVWITLLALADKHGEVHGSIPGIARVAGVEVEECREAFEVLAAPDPDSRTPDEEGRRILPIDGGWVLVNHQKYREMATDADRRAKNAARQQRWRDRQKRNASVTPALPQNSQAEAKADTEAEKSTPPNPPKGGKGRVRFQKPSLEEVVDAFAEKGWRRGLAEVFYDHYEANGWKVGRNPMKSWRHAMGTFTRNPENQKYKIVDNDKVTEGGKEFIKAPIPEDFDAFLDDFNPALKSRRLESWRQLHDEYQEWVDNGRKI